ncbi:MAG: chemotaxis protein CheW [Undibacterium umbellatum]|uniref:chemotaxis protein CheW n=1 Tax=Undibacterium umbellatum TaxID=2762300 RepID=UPI003BB6A3A5
MSAPQHIEQSAAKQLQADHGAQEYLVFTLGQEEYGIDIQIVQELRSYEAVTNIANSPDYIKGVINLRGNIIPIIDLRLRLGLPARFYDQFTVVIVVNLGGQQLGIIVDGVSDVIIPQTGQIQPAPQLSSVNETCRFTGVATLDDRMILLTDISRLVATNDFCLPEKVAA